jgi:hypothetical protein
MIGHIAGMPVEESVAYIAMSSGGAVVAIRVWFGRWIPRRAVPRRPELSVDSDRDLVE